MTAKGMKRIEANIKLAEAISQAIKAAHEAGMSDDDVKATLERFTSLMEEE